MPRIVPALAIAGIAAIALAGTSIAQNMPTTNPPGTTNMQRPDIEKSPAPAALRTEPTNIQRPPSANAAAQPYGWKSVDARALGDGHRSSKLSGSTIVNEANETIGTFDDLIVMSNDRAPYAVISVGGFLGMGSKYVVVPYSALQMRGEQVMLRGATKESLKALDEYKYPS